MGASLLALAKSIYYKLMKMYGSILLSNKEISNPTKPSLYLLLNIAQINIVIRYRMRRLTVTLVTFSTTYFLPGFSFLL